MVKVLLGMRALAQQVQQLDTNHPICSAARLLLSVIILTPSSG
jgi:hypothetical protein